MKRLGLFISNFTETGLFNFDIRAENTDDGLLHLGMPENVTELARFGIIHNYINNESRIRKCRDKNCESGPLVIDKKFVAESVSKYFGLELEAMDLDAIVDDVTAEFLYDGRLFHFDPESSQTRTMMQYITRRFRTLTMPEGTRQYPAMCTTA